MQVFLAWSGSKSKAVATALKEYVPLVVQGARPFMSTDIEIGARWNNEIRNQLSKATFGIICVTEHNSTSPWLLFEAGAISKVIDKSFVAPLLLDVDPSVIDEPLSQFQLTIGSLNGKCDRAGLLGLMGSINAQLDSEHMLTDEELRREFDQWWPDLHERIEKELRENEDERRPSWLYAFDDLISVQTTARTSILWVTPNASHHALEAPMLDVIKRCVERGVTYKFLLPDSQRSAEHARHLMELAGGKPDTIEVVGILSQEFEKAAVTDYVIIDEESDSKRVFFELPLQVRDQLPRQARDFWIDVTSPESSLGFADRFSELEKRYSTKLGLDLSDVSKSRTAP